MAARHLSTLSFSDVAAVRLLVHNVDEPPVFSSSVNRMVVSEAAPVGTDVGSVAAHDPDATNSPVRLESSHGGCFGGGGSRVPGCIRQGVSCFLQVLHRQEVRCGRLLQR